MVYLLDANVFMAAKNLHYGFDFCPAFWEWLLEAHARETVFSIDKVGDEIDAGDDDLAAWCRELPSTFFLRPDATVLPSLAAVSRWASTAGYEPAAVNTFLQIADYYLVAQAHATAAVVVTHEVPSGSMKRIKIPDACMSLAIGCVSPFEMLRRERARFVLG